MSKGVKYFYQTDPLSLPNVWEKIPSDLSVVDIEKVGYYSDEPIHCCFCEQRQKHNYGSLLILGDGTKAPCGSCCAKQFGFGSKAEQNEKAVKSARRAAIKQAKDNADEAARRKRIEEIRQESEAISAVALKHAHLTTEPLLRGYREFEISDDAAVLDLLLLHAAYDRLEYEDLSDVRKKAERLKRELQSAAGRKDSEQCVTLAKEFSREFGNLMQDGQAVIDSWAELSNQSDSSKPEGLITHLSVIRTKKAFLIGARYGESFKVTFAELKSANLLRFLDHL